MKILIENPPEWIMTGCLSKFRVDHKYTVWTYGDTLYNPGGTELPDHILEHEETHCDQQNNYVDTGLQLDELGMTCEEHYGLEFGHKLEDGTECAGPGMFPLKGKDAWWRRFLSDPAFRVSQEAEAYGMQYRYLCSIRKDRNERNRWLVHLTNQLSGPLYQSAIKPNDARALILKHAKV